MAEERAGGVGVHSRAGRVRSGQLELGSVRLAGAPAVSSHSCTDGVQGLCFYFNSKDMRLKAPDRVAVLTGKTKDGTPVFGADSVLMMLEPAAKPTARAAARE